MDSLKAFSRVASNRKYLALLAGTVFFNSMASHAGVFNIPHFVAPSEFAIGLEPQLDFTNPAGLGLNFRYTHGVTDTNNVIAIVGTGGGNRGLRAGGAFTFDVFPDVGNQPGIGMALQGLYVSLPQAGSMEVSAIPYIHKAFKLEQGNQVEPFLAFPLGLSLSQGQYQTIVTAAIGGIFQNTEHLRSVFEIGMGLNSATSTYISGGLTYYH